MVGGCSLRLNDFNRAVISPSGVSPTHEEANVRHVEATNLFDFNAFDTSLQQTHEERNELRESEPITIHGEEYIYERSTTTTQPTSSTLSPNSR